MNNTNSEEISNIQDILNEVNLQVPPYPTTSLPPIQDVNNEESNENNKNYVADINEHFQKLIYNNVLAPQLEENEKLKREQKKELMINVFKILKYQFMATYIFVIILLSMLLFNHYLEITDKIISLTFNFLKFYITSIVVELIAILFFIVRNVFDSSIFDLFKNFDRNTKENKDK